MVEDASQVITTEVQKGVKKVVDKASISAKQHAAEMSREGVLDVQQALKFLERTEKEHDQAQKAGP
jgi:hypothetical protein